MLKAFNQACIAIILFLFSVMFAIIESAVLLPHLFSIVCREFELFVIPFNIKVEFPCIDDIICERVKLASNSILLKRVVFMLNNLDSNCTKYE